MGEICFGCFSQLAKGGACPHCGYDPSEDIGKYPAALSAGTILNGKYILGRVLGQGGFGITYAAQDFSTKQRVAIKEFLPTAIASREATGQVSSFGSQRENFEHGKEGFMEEANALVDFKNNPHIVSVFDLFEANGTVYFVMEYVQGRNLKSYVKMMGGRLGEDAVNHILLPIMEALEDVHSKGLVHRDIAPDNIIVTADNSAKLIDFGAARYSTGEKSLSLDVVLKHGYAPKEQYMRRGRQGPFTDVYAMAATYYYAVTGRVPPDAIERGDADELYAPSTLGVKLSPHVEEALLKALEIQPADRYQTMGEFARAIKGGKSKLQEPADTKTDALPIEAAEPVKKETLPNPEETGEAKLDIPIEKKKSKKPLMFGLAAAVLAATVFLLTVAAQPKDVLNDNDSHSAIATEYGADMTLNAEKLYAAYAPDYVVMTVNGQDILWKDYFYFVNTNADTVSSYLLNAQVYGEDIGWEDELAEGETYLDYVVDYSEDVIRQMISIEGFAAEHGAGIRPENQQEIDAETERDKEEACGKGASENEFDAYLAQQYLSRELYERIGRVNYLYQNSFTAVYGENGAFVSDEDAINYLQTGGYIYVNHILYLTADMNTGEELDAETVENKLAGAQQMSEYLRTLEVEDKAELAARFAELKAQECEDSGQAAYPNGYVFLPGTMVPEFESASEALGEYEVSEPVKSRYGYHVIIRLPLDPDAVVEYSNEGTPLTGRGLYANQQFGIEMQNYHDSMEIKYAPNFEGFSIADYLE